MKTSVPSEIIDILRRLEGAGFETWCVGGAVRDALLGGSPKDFDLATAALPSDIRRVFPRTVPIGIEHGTVGVLDDANVLHEVTSFRKDVKSDGRHAVVEFGVSLDDDLARRDFTINAIAFHPIRQEWRDPFKGQEDLQRQIIRAVGDPSARFREDRLRILRAIRFAARFGFSIDPATLAAMKAQGGDTGHLSAERVRDEWVKSLGTARDVSTVTELWHECGVAAVWMPEMLLDRTSWEGMQRDDGRERPADHVVLTAVMTSTSAPVWKRFKGSGAEIQRAEALDRGPHRPSDTTPAAVRRWMSTVGEAAAGLLEVEYWRISQRDDGARRDFWEQWDEIYRTVIDRNDPVTREALALRGDDLIRSGVIKPGPAMGRVLDRMLNAVLEDPSLNTRDALLDIARKAV